MATKADLPQFESYFVLFVQVLRERGGSATIDEKEEDVAEAMELSDELLAVPHGDGPRTQFGYELAWVRTYLKKDGVAENSERGIWSLSARGLSLSDSEIAAIPQRVRAADYVMRRQREANQPEEGFDQPTIADVEGEEAELS